MSPTVTLTSINADTSAADLLSSAATVLQPGGVNCNNITELINAICCGETKQTDDDMSAFTYIVIVILFYALSIIILMVKYIRQEEDNARLEWYYDEFVNREHFRSGNPALWQKRRDSSHCYFFSEPPSTVQPTRVHSELSRDSARLPVVRTTAV
ncbi:PREDICTED: uncharacterized protein LOC106806339 [Priapulus caudatus]|uniref:Uncharacterized protein LOC106806339 n=1 Tax=Priapulus caudatus TaxID=37621 RepID=A0ABM1DUW0_PRICU|nr:PREDICTED: uncharacterized protein LOC106806339 [Priapulus caudatus]